MLRRAALPSGLAVVGARIACWAIALAVGLRGAWLIEDGLDDFDRMMAHYAVAFAALFAATAQIDVDALRRSPIPWLRTWFRDHRWELVGLAAVLALAAFMRFYNFGHYPPSTGLALEENQTGGHAYRIIHEGSRPLEHIVVNYAATLGFLLAEPSASSLRVPMIALGMVAVAVFYLLMRELVPAPPALFATALFAGSRWLAWGAATADELFTGVAVEVAALYFFVRTLRTGGAWSAIMLGLTGSIIMYEYVAYNVLPPVIAAFALVVCAWSLWRRRSELNTAIAQGARRFAVPLAALLVTVVLGLLPQYFESRRGQLQFGYASFSRDEAQREGEALGGLLPGGWQERVRWGIETFTTGGDGLFVPLKLAGEALVDPVTAVLLVIALGYCVVFFFRPFRAMFAVWFVGVVTMGVAVPLNFHPGRLTPIMPVALIMIGLLVADAGRLGIQKLEARGTRRAVWLWAALVPVAVLASALNWHALHREQAEDPVARIAYADSRFYACDYLRQRDTHGIVYTLTMPASPMFVPSDYAWICAKARGQAITSPSELWGMSAVDGRGVDLMYEAFLFPPADITRLLTEVFGAEPERTETHYDTIGREMFRVSHLSEAELTSYRGLNARIVSDGGAVQTAAVSAPAPGAEWSFTAGEGIEATLPYTVEWQGLVHAPSGATSLAFDGVSGSSVMLDGAPMTDDAITPGWHFVSGRSRFEREGDRVSLVWRRPGRTQAVTGAEMFAYAGGHGLMVERELQPRSEDQPAMFTHAVGWPIAITEPEAARGELIRETGFEAALYAGERWTGFITVTASTPPLRLEAQRGSAELRIDGQVVAFVESTNNLVEETSITLPPPGRYPIELIITGERAAFSGARIVVDDGEFGSMPPLEMFEPY